jgi:hypothetical protein
MLVELLAGERGRLLAGHGYHKRTLGLRYRIEVLFGPLYEISRKFSCFFLLNVLD